MVSQKEMTLLHFIGELLFLLNCDVFFKTFRSQKVTTIKWRRWNVISQSQKKLKSNMRIVVYLNVLHMHLNFSREIQGMNSKLANLTIRVNNLQCFTEYVNTILPEFNDKMWDGKWNPVFKGIDPTRKSPLYKHQNTSKAETLTAVIYQCVFAVNLTEITSCRKPLSYNLCSGFNLVPDVSQRLCVLRTKVLITRRVMDPLEKKGKNIIFQEISIPANHQKTLISYSYLQFNKKKNTMKTQIL